MLTTLQPSRRIFRRNRLAEALLATLLTPFAAVSQTAPAASADAADAKPTSAIETIVVTARKRAEESQSVPVAVTAFSTESLKRANIENAADVQFAVPNAILVGGDTFTIRGIGNGSLGGDAGVGVFLNGASISPLSQDFFYDLERIEFLRGPQGTLFGRNTTGGAVNVKTKIPQAKFGGEFFLESGNYKEQRVGGAINIPVTADFAQRFAGYVYKRDGFTKNVFTGNKIDGRDQYALRSSSRMYFGDATTANLMLSMYKEDSTRTRETKRLCKADAVLGCSATELGFDSPNAAATILQTLARSFTPFPAGGNLYAGAPNPANPREVAADTDPIWKLEQRNATLDVTHEFDNHSLTYVGGYSWSSTTQNTDWDNAALPFRFTRPITYNSARDTTITTDQLITTDSFAATGHSSSHELRLTSKYQGMMNFTVGAFALDTAGSTGFFAFHPAIELFQKALGRPAESWFVNTQGRGTLKATAAFGEANFKLSNELRATVGVRHTTEDRTSISRTIVLAAPGPEIQVSSSASKTTGKFSLDYTPSRDSMVYASVATGYKGGGFNIGNTTSPSFKPEEVNAFELGSKNLFANGTLQANFSVFYNDYKNMQLGQRIGGTVLTSNADAKTKGVEAEFVWAPSKPWLFDANFSTLNTRIGDFLTVDATNPAQNVTIKTPVVAVNLNGKELPYSPTKKYKLGVQYTTPFMGTGWMAIARLDHVWQDTYFAREFNNNIDRIGAWSVTNAMLRFVNPSGTLQLKAYVKNLANHNNITRIVVEDALIGGYRNARYLDPRTFGVALEYKF